MRPCSCSRIRWRHASWPALVAASHQDVRVGLAHGEIVAIRGDFDGLTVNLAARLVAAATPSTILASESLRDACGGRVRPRPGAGRTVARLPRRHHGLSGHGRAVLSRRGVTLGLAGPKEHPHA